MSIITREQTKGLVRSIPSELTIEEVRNAHGMVLVYEGVNRYVWKNQITESNKEGIDWIPILYLDMYQRKPIKNKIKRKKLMDLDNQVYYIINESEVAKRIIEERR